MLGVTRQASGWRAGFVSPVGIYHCVGARTDAGNRTLSLAYTRGGEADVRSLRRDPHEPEPPCWLHGDTFCLRTNGGED